MCFRLHNFLSMGNDLFSSFFIVLICKFHIIKIASTATTAIRLKEKKIDYFSFHRNCIRCEVVKYSKAMRKPIAQKKNIFISNIYETTFCVHFMSNEIQELHSKESFLG